MENKEFARQLELRTRKFAVTIIRLSGKLPWTPESKVLRYQVTKSGSSIGANYHEANRSRSKADFINKIRLCEFESSETVYWLGILNELDWITHEKLSPILAEAIELLAIFTSIGKSLRP
jgi:four helix bundle protein